MTDEEFYAGMFTLGHKNDCGWHCDQYWWECDCGAIKPEIHAEWQRRQSPQETAE